MEDLEDEIQNVFNYDLKRIEEIGDEDTNDMPDKYDLPEDAQEAIDGSAGM